MSLLPNQNAGATPAPTTIDATPLTQDRIPAVFVPHGEHDAHDVWLPVVRAGNMDTPQLSLYFGPDREVNCTYLTILPTTSINQDGIIIRRPAGPELGPNVSNLEYYVFHNMPLQPLCEEWDKFVLFYAYPRDDDATAGPVNDDDLFTPSADIVVCKVAANRNGRRLTKTVLRTHKWGLHGVFHYIRRHLSYPTLVAPNDD